MFEPITPEGLKIELLKNIKSEGWNTSEGSFADLLAGPVAYEIWKRYMQDRAIPAMLYVEENSGEYIDKAVEVFGLKRKEGTKAVANMQTKGEAGTVVPENTTFLTMDGVEFRHFSYTHMTMPMNRTE